MNNPFESNRYKTIMSGKKVHNREISKLHVRLKRWAFQGRAVVPCAGCSRLLFLTKATLEHIVPTFLGGTYDPWNLTITCYKCNCKRPPYMDFWVWRVLRHQKMHRRPVPHHFVLDLDRTIE